MKYKGISKKILLKWDHELVELHKKVITTYLASIGIKYSVRVKFFKLYDMAINEGNIRSYFYTPTNLLVKYLVLGKLDLVATYIITPKKKIHGKKVKGTVRKR